MKSSSFHQDHQQHLLRRFIIALLLLCTFSWLMVGYLYFFSPQTTCSSEVLPSPEKLVYRTDNCRSSTFKLEYNSETESSDCINNSSSQPPSTNSTLHHLIFSLWWPPTVAKGQPKLQEKASRQRKWLIRGLITQSTFEAPPKQSSYHQDAAFEDDLTNKLSALMPNLADYQDDSRYWHRLYNAWGRHSNFTPAEYLKACVDLYLSPKLNLTAWQRNSMKRPSDIHGYRWDDFLAGFPARDSVQLICQLDKEVNGTLGSGRQYLREIQICVDNQLQLSSPSHCYYTDNICDRCRPFYFSSTLF